MIAIINADDLGGSPRTNKAIFDLMAAGKITSATLLANGPSLKEALRHLGAFPQCSFGVHLNVTEYAPLGGKDGLEALLDKTGHFSGEKRVQEVRLTSALSAAIYKEWCAQVDRLLGLGVSLSHIDSHHHVHTLPRLFPVLKRVQRTYGLRKVRISRNIYAARRDLPVALALRKRAFNFMLRHYYKTQTTSGFADLWSICHHDGLERWRGKVIEIMVHPGADMSEEERSILWTDWTGDLVIRPTLMSYNEL